MAQPLVGEERRKALVLVFRRRPRPIVYIRDYPRSAYDPSLAQIDVRLRFAEAARRVKGSRWRGVTPMPLAAYAVARALRGYRSPYRRPGPRPKWVDKILAMSGYYGVSRDQLENAVNRILAALRRAAPATYR